VNLTSTLDKAQLASFVEAIAERVLARLADRDNGDAWPEWMSIPTAARYLDVSPERVRKLIARHALPAHREAPGCRVFLRRRDLDATMEALRT
jgi:excisionase family DNA binding protein